MPFRTLWRAAVTDIAVSSFDVLAIAHNMSENTNGVTEPEVHVFSYLACLLSLYAGRDASWWAYEFSATKDGAPYSKEISESCSLLIANGSLKQVNQLLKITDRGATEVDLFKSLIGFTSRLRYLIAACESTLSIPVATIREVLSREPQLRSAISHMQARPLLDEMGMALLKPHLEGLREVLIGARGNFEDYDLLVPAVLWLTYLGREGR
jgi:hypothetical protein